MSKQIAAAEVTRDKFGHWNHPDVPQFNEGQSCEWNDWIKSQGIEVSHQLMADDPAAEAAYERYGDGDDDALIGWTPAPPDGDDWFLLAIDETEDGPAAWFARPNAKEPA